MKRSGFKTMSPYRYPFYILLHPKDGFQELKANKKASLTMTFLIVLFWLLGEVFYRAFMDYDMNPYNIENTSLLRVSIITVIIYVMACVANWCFCTLLDGKGRMADIFTVASYSLLPYVIVRFITVLASRFMVGDEQMIMTYCVVISQVWCALLVIIGLQEIHEYTVKKVILSLILTAVGIIIMLFLALMVIMLFQQLLYFIYTVAYEIRY